MDGVEEYNSFGFASTNPKYRVDDQSALELYGFKAGGFAKSCLLNMIPYSEKIWTLIDTVCYMFGIRKQVH